MDINGISDPLEMCKNIIYDSKFAKDHFFLVKYIFLYLEEITQVFLCFLEF